MKFPPDKLRVPNRQVSLLGGKATSRKESQNSMATNNNPDRELSERHKSYFQDNELFYAQIRHRAHYRPKTHDPEITKLVAADKKAAADSQGRTVVTFDCSSQDYAYMCSSLLDFTVPELVFKGEAAKTHEIRLVGDLHGAIREANLHIDGIILKQTTLSLDAGVTVPRRKAAEYRKHCLKDSDLRNWANQISETRTCLPQTWSYCIHEHEAIPIHTGSKVKHEFIFALALAQLFEMRKKKGGKGVIDTWESIPFDSSLLEGDISSLPVPKFWVNYSQMSEEEIEKLRKPEELMRPIEKRYIDFIPISPPNPEKSGLWCIVDIKTSSDWAVLSYIYAGTRSSSEKKAGKEKKVGEHARDQVGRYLTERGEPAARTFRLQYAETPHTEELDMAISQGLQYLRSDSAVMNSGIGIFSSGNLGLTGTDTFTDGLSSKMTKVLVKLGESQHKYRVRVALCCMRTLIFQKGQPCREPDSKKEPAARQLPTRESPASTYY